MIVAGRVSQKMAPVLRQVYDQMMEPKWVISMGVCASTGGMFNNYAIVQGVDQIVPVDVYAPGCPPTPETLLHAIETLHQLIEDGELMRRRARAGAAPTSTSTRSRRQASRPGPAREQVSDVGRDRDRRGRVEAPIDRAVRLRAPRRCGQTVVHPTREQYVDARQGARRRRLHDVRRPHRRRLPRPPRAQRCPRASHAERFEVVVNLLDIGAGRRIRLRVQVPEDDPTLPTLFDIHPGTEAMEREVYDMFGITFTDHPDLDADPDAGGLGGPPAAQGLRGRRDPGAVQGGARVTIDERRSIAHRRHEAAGSRQTTRGDGQELKPRSRGTGQGAAARGRRRAADERGRGGRCSATCRRTPTRTRR